MPSVARLAGVCYRPPEMVMRSTSLVGRFARGALAGATALVAANLQQPPAMAQGSTGGNIGKQDKSVSGEKDGGGSTRSMRSSKPRGDRGDSGSNSPGCIQAKRTLKAAMALGFDDRDGVITAVRAKCGR
jgi:hypothetical protein